MGDRRPVTGVRLEGVRGRPGRRRPGAGGRCRSWWPTSTTRRRCGRLAASTRVLATTVGPYLRHGDAVVAACAAEGTDYLDLTGEAGVRRPHLARHHATAERTGPASCTPPASTRSPTTSAPASPSTTSPTACRSRCTATCGPMGSFSGGIGGLRPRLPRPRRRGAPRRRRARDGSRAHRPAGHPHPGTDARRRRLVAARSRRSTPRSSCARPPPSRLRAGLHLQPLLRRGSPAGPARSPSSGWGCWRLLAQVRPLRSGLERLVPAGSGPTADQRAQGSLRGPLRRPGGGRQVVTRVTGGDPGYTETSMMLAESALCLAYDDLPEVAGQITTAIAMGEALTARLRARPASCFEVVAEGPSHDLTAREPAARASVAVVDGRSWPTWSSTRWPTGSPPSP